MQFAPFVAALFGVTALAGLLAAAIGGALTGLVAVLGATALAAALLALWALARAQASQRAAQTAVRGQARLLAVASHDMAQPLHALTLYLSALERRVDGEEAKAILAKMDSAAASLTTMFAGLLDYARLQSGAVRPEPSDFPLQEIFDRIAAQYPGRELAAAPTRIVLRSDPALIERALNQLVSNALRHAGAARISAAASGARADIVVADDGPGIAPGDQQRVFEEFVRLEGPHMSEGLGLGLAIARRIADLLGCELIVDSAPGAGARFVLSAPVAPRARDDDFSSI